MKKLSIAVFSIISLCSLPLWADGNLQGNLILKKPGGNAVSHPIKIGEDGKISASVNGISINGSILEKESGKKDLDVKLISSEPVYFNLAFEYASDNIQHADCDFYMPGFWYHKNERSPENAPSLRISDSWTVREDRLSSSLTGVFSNKDGEYMRVMRIDNDNNSECMTQNLSGDIILSGPTSVGFIGFSNINGNAALSFGFPYQETPKRYIRKLTLIDPVRAFVKIEPSDTIDLKWRITEGNSKDFSDFVAETWTDSYDELLPKEVEGVMDSQTAKQYLSQYFDQSYVDDYDVKYFSGEGLRTADCDSQGGYQVGFVGRVLLNAFNAIEYGNQNNRPDLIEKGQKIFDSVLKNGFTPEGYFIEAANFEHDTQDDFLSIRRQSEGVFAMLNWLDYERKNGLLHLEWENKLKNILDKMVALQGEDGSFPRKFDGNHRHIDSSGGSTPSATLPLTMAYKYFNEPKYLEAAKKSADYLEKEIINPADYFSSTLDANCEDKEASLYASTAMYYLTHVTNGEEKEKYMDLCKKAAYFCLSWYYLWDVPFSPGQMLGDVNFKSRGWGNVSVENNHIDVFIFEFATILDKLGQHYSEPRFSDFSKVITGSMLQLMPTEEGCFDIAKVGYYPEVVQHTTWDYGKNGKGFYNDIFAPGWTVASLWQMLSPDRVDKFFD